MDSVVVKQKNLNYLKAIIKGRFNFFYTKDILIKNKITYDYINYKKSDIPITFSCENIQEFENIKKIFINKFKSLSCQRNEFKRRFGDLTLKQAYCYNYFTNNRYRCCFCGQLLELSETEKGYKYVHADIEHIFPKSKFPQFTFHPDNLVPSCKECNQGEKNDQFFDKKENFHEALKDLGINELVHPLNLWENNYFDFDNLSNIKIINNKESNGYKLLEYYGIPKRTGLIIKHCYDILFNILKYSDLRSPESLEKLLENIASSNWHEVNDGYSINNSPQIWQEFIESILYNENKLIALWEELRDSQSIMVY